MSVSLLFDDDIELNSDIGEADGYQFQILASSRRGDPVPVEVTLASFLRDGAIVEHDHDENRELLLQVRISAPDSLALKLGKARLARATKKRTTLVWSSVDGIAPDEVFDVMTSTLTQPQDDGWDLDEVRNQVTFGLRLVCLPYSRSAELTVDEAGTPPSTGGTVFNTCESTTGWAAGASLAYAPVYAVDSVVFSEGTGSIKSRTQKFINDFDAGTAQSTIWDVVSGMSQSTGSGGYLGVRIRFQWTLVNLRIWVTTAENGREEVLTPLAASMDTAGFVHYVWPVDASLTVTAMEIRTVQSGPVITSVGTNPHYVWYDAQELLPAATTDHQIVKQLTVEGSARTPGSLRISAATESVALDQVLAITAPTDDLPPGFLPDGRRWITQGTTTADATALGGSYLTPDASTYSTAAGKPIFDVPAAGLTTGPYTIVALAKTSSSPLVLGIQAQLRVGSTNIGPISVAELSTPTASTSWQFVTVGTVYLPPLPMQSADSTAKVRLLFKGTAKLADVYMIPAWQSGGRAVADFTIVDCGTGTVSASGASSSLWIDSSSVAQPQGGYWRGPTLDRVNARSAWPDTKIKGEHEFKPGCLSAFVVSTGAAGPTVGLSYYEAAL